jgi:hypothetical protein
MSHFALFLLTVLNNVAPATTQRTEVHTSVTRAPQRSDGPVLTHTNANYRLVRAWCEENPGRCVRVGNTYIVQGS